MSRSRGRVLEATRLEMTPMIDVTFLLLVFFLCTIRFKTLEGKIPAFLPRDRGVNDSPVTQQLERVPIHITRQVAVDTDPARNPDWTWREDQLRVRVGPREVALAELHEVMANLASQSPDAKATLYPERGTLYIDTVKVLNECLRGGFHAVTLARAPGDP